MIKVSIIIPAYNVEDYISRCLDSIINQKLKEIEIIIINDGSTDSTLSICEKYKSIDNRIVIINKCNEGVSAARNEGLKLAKGDYIGFVDPDDWIENDMYYNLYKNLELNNGDVALCGYKIKKPNQNIDVLFESDKKVMTSMDEIIDNIVSSMISQKNIFSSSLGHGGSVCRLLIKRNIIFDNNISFDNNLKYGEDLLFCILVFLNSKRVVIDNSTYYNYFLRNGSACNKYRKDFYSEIIAIMKKLTSILKTYNVYERLVYRLEIRYYNMYRLYISKLFKKGFNVTYKEKISIIRNFCNDTYIERIVQKQNINSAPFLKKIYIFSVKKKFIHVIYIYHKLMKFVI